MRAERRKYREAKIQMDKMTIQDSEGFHANFNELIWTKPG